MREGAVHIRFGTHVSTLMLRWSTLRFGPLVVHARRPGQEQLLLLTGSN